MGERGKDLHHRSIAPEGEDGAVLLGVVASDRGGVSVRLGWHHIALNAGFGKRFLRSLANARRATRCGIDDEQDALDPAGRKLHRGCGAQNWNSSLIRRLIWEFSCSGRGSNPHGSLSQGILSPSRLPVSPPERRGRNQRVSEGNNTLGKHR